MLSRLRTTEAAGRPRAFVDTLNGGLTTWRNSALVLEDLVDLSVAAQMAGLDLAYSNTGSSNTAPDDAS